MTSTDALLQINQLLGQLSPAELMTVAKAAQTRATAASKSSLSVGDTVSFDAKTRGVKTGTLIKKNTKTFQVLVGSTTWKVSPTLLKKAA